MPVCSPLSVRLRLATSWASQNLVMADSAHTQRANPPQPRRGLFSVFNPFWRIIISLSPILEGCLGTGDNCSFCAHSLELAESGLVEEHRTCSYHALASPSGLRYHGYTGGCRAKRTAPRGSLGSPADCGRLTVMYSATYPGAQGRQAYLPT